MRLLLVTVVVIFCLCVTSVTYAQFSLTGTDPQRSTIIAQNELIRLQFSQPVAGATTGGAISLMSDLRGNLPFSATVSGGTVTIIPLSTFYPAEEITIYLRTTLTSTGGISLPTPAVIRYSVKNGVSKSVPPNFIENNRMTFPIEHSIGNTYAADMDSDEDIDICFYSSTVGWMENDGKGNFTRKDIAPLVNGSADDVMAGDLELDGDMDIVTVNGYSGITVYLNNGSQNFTAKPLGAVNSVSKIDLVDFNNDGLLDILFSGREEIADMYIEGTWILYNEGAGVFSKTKINSAQAYRLITEDMDNDGDVDAQFGNHGLQYLNNNGSAFISSDIEVADRIYTLDAANLNNDAYVDLITMSTPGSGLTSPSIDFWINNGSFNFTKISFHDAAGGLVYLTCGDFDGDSDTDIIATDGNYNFVMLENDGAAVFTKRNVAQSLSNFFDPKPNVKGDFDGDSDLDFAVAAGNILRFFENDLFPFDDVASDIKAVEGGDADWGDYDNDGDLDMIITGFADGKTTADVFENNNGHLSLFSSLPGVFHGSCDWGDFDNDGDLDILVMGAKNTTIDNRDPITGIYVNDGESFTILPSSLIQLPQTWHGKARWADMNNNGSLDIVINAREACGVYASDGNGNFSKKYTFTGTSTDGNFDTGDYDLDGDLDIVLSGYGSGLFVDIFRNDGNWQFEKIPDDIEGRFGGNVHWNDMENDGDLDLIVSGSTLFAWGGGGLPTNTVYRNDLGTFTKIETSENLGYTDRDGTSAAGDLDNDGATDLLASTWGGSSFAPETNLLINNGNGELKRLNIELPKVATRVVTLGDFDRDHDLDIFVGSKLLRNKTESQNTRPLPPTILELDSVYNNSIFVHWSSGADINTPADGLTYQLYAGTESKKQNVVSANANLATGLRKLSEPGPLKQKRYTINNVNGGTHFVGVQSVDASYEGSTFSHELQVNVIEIQGNTGGCLSLNSTYTAVPAANYTWQVVGGDIISGQGTNKVVVKWTSIGKGYVKVADATGPKNTVEVMVDDEPAPTIAGDNSVCSGFEKYTVVDGKTTSVEWLLTSPNEVESNSARGGEVHWVAQGEYTLTARAYPLNKGCYVDASIDVSVDLRPTPEISGNFITCQNDVNEYTTNSTGGEWKIIGGEIASETALKVKVKWPTVTLGSVIINQSSSPSFCSASDTLKVNVNPRPAKPFITLFRDTILLSSQSPNNFYRWYYNGEEVGYGPYEGLISHIPGIFVVEIFDANGFCGSKSDPFYFLVTGTEESNSDETALRIYPNPADRNISLELSTTAVGECRVEIHSANGNLAIQRTFVSVEQLTSDPINVTSLASGIYTVRLITNTRQYQERFIKK